MTLENWNRIRYFTPREKWGDWTWLQEDLIFKLDAMRRFAGVPIIIHCAYDTFGHSKDSYHYKGMAADLHFVGRNLLDQFIIASRFFSGIGCYDETVWQHSGLHVDIRRTAATVPEARWGATRINGKRTYVKLNSEFFESTGD